MRKSFHHARVRAFAHKQAGTPNPDADAGGPMNGWGNAEEEPSRVRADAEIGPEDFDGGELMKTAQAEE